MTPRLAIVTGTTSGIGGAVATRLLDRGWDVVGIARRPSPFSHPRYRHHPLDLAAIPAQADELEEWLSAELGRAHWERIGLVNNAALTGDLGPSEQIDAGGLLNLLAVNVVAPVWLMGWLVRRAPVAVPARIVNVSSGVARAAFPGLGAYAASKAALRMAGMVLAAELDSGLGPHAPTDLALLSYEPGIVDTAMQTGARELSPQQFPWEMFRSFAEQDLLVPPEAPAAEIAEFLESGRRPRFSERRLGDPA